ncbi:hypothetical protein CEXT_436381 [Caerostris extrusa]|uniref:Secreted protein n=1 Tax=Caerostris extrusa TaxID=172846 RepID=A0AAV4NR32_CAEEX|nr:hypothetical protein CEXT_436381 [Caerostris extrusa]
MIIYFCILLWLIYRGRRSSGTRCPGNRSFQRYYFSPFVFLLSQHLMTSSLGPRSEAARKQSHCLHRDLATRLAHAPRLPVKSIDSGA